MTLYLHELKMNFKNLLIWTLCIGILCFSCIPLYSSLQDSLADMAHAYSSMGAFSTAFGMDKLSLATLTGFYATEIAIMFSLGGSMYAAILGASLLSKEEAGHTAEFLMTIPLSRRTIVFTKFIAMITNIVIFNLVCTISFVFGFMLMKEEIPFKTFILYHTMQIVMQLEIACICFLLSSLSKKNKTGAALGLAILLYGIDMMCRIIPAITNLKYITPFYYANGASIFSNEKISIPILLIGLTITLCAAFASFLTYEHRDLAS